MKYLILALSLVGCTATTHQTQLQVADAIGQGLNTFAPRIVEAYTIDLRTCRIEAAGNTPKYIECAMGVEQNWGPLKDAWRRVRRMQDAYASALEKKEPSLPDYASWLQTAFCELKSAAPASLKLPAIPGVSCHD